MSNIRHQHRCGPPVIGFQMGYALVNIETYLLFVSVFFVFVEEVRTEFEQNKDECQS